MSQNAARVSIRLRTGAITALIAGDVSDSNGGKFTTNIETFVSPICEAITGKYSYTQIVESARRRPAAYRTLYGLCQLAKKKAVVADNLPGPKDHPKEFARAIHHRLDKEYEITIEELEAITIEMDRRRPTKNWLGK